MDDQSMDRLLKDALKLKEKEKELNESNDALFKEKVQQEKLTEFQTKTLFNVSLLCEKMQSLDKNRHDLKKELSDLKNALILNQMQIAELSNAAKLITKSDKKGESVPESKKVALKTTEFLQNSITKVIMKGLKSENLEVDSSDISDVANDLEKVINELKKKDVIADSEQDIIARNEKEIKKLLA